MAAPRRIQKELMDYQAHPQASIASLTPRADDIYKWDIVMNGPAGTPYAGGRFRLLVQFPPNYPFEAPKVSFAHPVYHMNVEKDGSHVCLNSLLPGTWRPTVKMTTVVDELAALLANPNPDHAVVAEYAALFNTDRVAYDRAARECTQHHAH
ncbi:putative ubiquitin-conjugating enzyme e2 d e [Paratrimastix pyriformis]|uniref:Ubiquitin-conjugating enzyme e2 d e n=1 Tax=Paratrimastix pyriformis TaxID=342808 RepID=A0ABQ8UF62_9EUKA|nr:putative ubiquitin-conjugating enzyme e2 d e [Paratrimastix pyriformis]